MKYSMHNSYLLNGMKLITLYESFMVRAATANQALVMCTHICKYLEILY